jgi:orotate phosphoribosyltransferase
MALSHPEARRLIGELAITKLHDRGFQAVGGLALGAYPIAIAISDALYHLDGREIRAFVVRKDPKTHGLQKYLEGDVTRGDRVLIVDDVITTGASTLTAIEKSQEVDLKIVQALVVVDRQEDNGRQNIESHGITFDALFTLPELSQYYHKMHAHR